MRHRTVFLGTPSSAVPSLLTLHERTAVGLVVTQPDRPRSRSARPVAPAVKEAAAALGLPVAQPAGAAELAAALGEVGPIDVGVVVAFGMLLRPAVLSLPRAGFVNVHFSLLPRWRGAAPVERAILAGDPETGVSLMVMDEGLDTGPILSRRRTEIGAGETGGELTERLARIGAELLGRDLGRYLSDELPPTPQPEGGTSYAPKLQPAEAKLDPTLPVLRVERMIRAFNPRPGAWMEVAGQRMKVLAASIIPTRLPSGRLEVAGQQVLAGFGDGTIELLWVQPAGRKAMAAGAWARGARPFPDRFA